MTALRVQHRPHSIWYTNPSLLNALISITGAHVQGKIVIKAICVYYFHSPTHTLCVETLLEIPWFLDLETSSQPGLLSQQPNQQKQ